MSKKEKISEFFKKSKVGAKKCLEYMKNNKKITTYIVILIIMVFTLIVTIATL